MKLIIIAGMPATGKSMLSAKLSSAFGFPVLEKDTIKEQLFDTLGFTCYAEKRHLDVVANRVLLSVIESLREADTSVIAVNNFSGEAAEELKEFLTRKNVQAATVFLTGEAQVLYERYYERDKNGKRHLGHAMQRRYPPSPEDPEVFDMTREGFDERFLKLGMDRIHWDGPVFYVDATYPETIDTSAILGWIKDTLLKEKAVNDR